MRLTSRALLALSLSTAPLQAQTAHVGTAASAVQETKTQDPPTQDPPTQATQPVPAPAQPATPTQTKTDLPKRHKRKPSAPAVGPRKIVVREGGAKEPAAQIAPDLNPAEAARQRQNADRLLNSTDDQLNLLKPRVLNPQQLETVGQIHNYLDGARSALKEGDLRRADTLAQKAHLLTEDLLKH